MRYVRKEGSSPPPQWHIVEDGNDRYWVARSDRVDWRVAWAQCILDQRDREHVVFTETKPGAYDWRGIEDQGLRREIIATAWPMIEE